MRARHGIVVALVVWALGVWAQTPPAASTGSGYRTFQFSVFGIGVRPEGVYVLGPREARIPLRFQAATRSLVHEYAGPVPLEMYRDVEAADGTKVRTVVARVDIPEGTRQVLILVGPTGRADIPYAGVAVEDSVENLRAGMMRVLNYSGESLTALVGTTVHELPAGPSLALPLPADGDVFPFQLAALREGTWRLVMETQLPRTETDRVVAIVLPATEPGGGPRVRLLRERIVETAVRRRN